MAIIPVSKPLLNRPIPQTRCSTRAGFSLLELAIVLTIVALVAGSGMMMGQSMIESAKLAQTNNKLNTIEKALMAYRLTNNRLPCPADAALATTNANYGAQAGSLVSGQWVADAGSCVTYGTYAGGALTATAANSVAANFSYTVPTPSANTSIASTGKVAEGAIPFKALNLPADFMYDGWGRKFAYAVWTPLTAAATTTTPAAFITYGLYPSCGAITIKDAGGTARTLGAAYALMSYGPDGHGGYTKAGTRYNAGSTNTDEQANAHFDQNGGALTYAAAYVQKEATQSPTDTTNVFDDLVRYKARWQMQTDRDRYAATGNPCSPGFAVNGYQVGDSYRFMTPAIADVNGDGIPDLILGDGDLYSSYGAAYVVFGTKSGFPDPLPLSSCNGTNCAEFKGQINGSYTGVAVAAGDINGDGIADVIIDSIYHGTYVVFGHKGNWNAMPQTLNSAFLNGTNGFEVDLANGAFYSTAVGAGDVNGDGIADLIIGARLAGDFYATGDVTFGANNPTDGQSIVLNGVTWTFKTVCDAPSCVANSETLIGADYNATLDNLASDLNSSANPKLSVARYSHAGGIGQFGISYKTFGAAGNTYTLCDPSAVPAICAGDQYLGDPHAWSSDWHLTGGYDNGSPSQNEGAAYVVFGGRSGANNSTGSAWTACPCTLNSAFLNGTNGVEFDGTLTNESVGTYVAAGDVNGDGIADIAIGTGSASNKAFLVFGKRTGWSGTPSPLDGTFLTGTSTSGVEFDTFITGPNPSLAFVAIGDVNGDGLADLIIGAPHYSFGAVYVVFGKGSGWPTVATTLDTTFVNGINAVKYAGISGYSMGASVATGDINGDGINDILMTAGQSPYPLYIAFGKKALLPQPTVTTTAGSANATVSSYSGLIVGQTVNASTIPAGYTIKTCGGSSTVGTLCTSTSIVLSSGTGVTAGTSTMYVAITPVVAGYFDGVNGAELDGIEDGANGAGDKNIAAGDINGDGIADIIATTPYTSPGGVSDAGTAYVYFGRKYAWPTSAVALSGM